LEITLNIKGEEKTFVQEFAPLKLYRKALEVEDYAEQKDAEEEKLFDKRLNLIVEVFDKQFTKNELENGLNVINHKEVMYNVIAVGILGNRSLEEQEELGKFMREMEEMAKQEKSQSTTA